MRQRSSPRVATNNTNNTNITNITNNVDTTRLKVVGVVGDVGRPIAVANKPTALIRSDSTLLVCWWTIRTTNNTNNTNTVDTVRLKVVGVVGDVGGVGVHPVKSNTPNGSLAQRLIETVNLQSGQRRCDPTSACLDRFEFVQQAMERPFEVTLVALELAELFEVWHGSLLSFSTRLVVDRKRLLEYHEVHLSFLSRSFEHCACSLRTDDLHQGDQFLARRFDPLVEVLWVDSPASGHQHLFRLAERLDERKSGYSGVVVVEVGQADWVVQAASVRSSAATWSRRISMRSSAAATSSPAPTRLLPSWPDGPSSSSAGEPVRT
jgi:hypothetical protein